MDKEAFVILGMIAALFLLLFVSVALGDYWKKDCTIKLAGQYTASEIVLMCK